MLIIESKHFLFPVYYRFSSFFDYSDVIAYYNPKTKMLLPGNKSYIDTFKQVKRGLDRNQYIVKAGNICLLYKNQINRGR